MRVDGRVALGHRRLSIIDLSISGAQPMTKGDPEVTLAHNVEVCKYRELRAELEDLGSTFRGVLGARPSALHSQKDIMEQTPAHQAQGT